MSRSTASSAVRKFTSKDKRPDHLRGHSPKAATAAHVGNEEYSRRSTHPTLDPGPQNRLRICMCLLSRLADSVDARQLCPLLQDSGSVHGYGRSSLPHILRLPFMFTARGARSWKCRCGRAGCSTVVVRVSREGAGWPRRCLRTLRNIFGCLAMAFLRANIDSICTLSRQWDTVCCNLGASVHDWSRGERLDRDLFPYRENKNICRLPNRSIPLSIARKGP